MSGLPPQLDTAQPGTPSGEWARSTTTAAFSRTEPAPALSSATSGANHTHATIPPTSAALSMSAADSAQKGAFDPSLVKPTPSSPGAQFPGAYPPTPGDQSTVTQAPVSMDAVRDTAQNAAGTASSFVQSAAQTAAQYLPQGVVDTVSAYIPTSSATSTMTTARASEHDAEHTTSFPTKEVSGASSGERTGGVGSLPGVVTESGVPKLPDEREEHERYTTAAGAAAILAASAYAAKDRVLGAMPSAQDTEVVKETVQQKAQGTAQTVKQAIPSVPGVARSRTTAVTASTIPTREHFGAQPGDHSSGVGALPGDQDEPHVARLPEESARPQFDSGPMDTAAQIGLKPSEETFGNEAAVGDARHVGGIGALIGGRSESGVGVLPDERVQQRGTGTGTVTHPSTGKQALPMTQPKGETPAALSPPKEQHKTPEGTSEKAQKSGHHGQPNKVSRDVRTFEEYTLPGDPGTGRFAHAERDVDGKPCETQANLLSATLRPRAHALGAERARWGRVPLDGEHARYERVTDFDGPDGEIGKGPGYDTDYHPAELHPPTESPGEPASSGEKSLGATQADAHRPPEEAQPPHQTRDEDDGGSARREQKAKKAGFMDKMKGEAKVLLGKIEGKHEKVEQGKQIKAGETPRRLLEDPAEDILVFEYHLSMDGLSLKGVR
ncbi:hypothetical protein C8Q79DRAFT_920695 [Trametes meyenii]|nr:hypothetical protein C8Q79DRAFT_920695 [Trametes meyenii]